MLTYIGRRLLAALPVLLLASAASFLVVHLIPGDPADALFKYATGEQIAKLRADMGLDRPLPVQYVSWLGKMAAGDFGRQVSSGREVREQIGRRLPATIELAAAAMLIAVVVGIPLGIAAAVRKRTWVDGTASVVALSGLSLPVFWLGLMLMLAFGGVFANGGRYDVMIDYTTPEDGYWTGFLFIDALAAGKWDLFWSGAQHIVLPAVALATIPLAMIVRVTRTAMVEVLNQDYVRTARAKGMAEKRVIFMHALRNAMIPILTITATQAGYLMGGAALTEKVFAWPGLGSYTVDAVIGRDYPSVQASVLLAAVVFVAVNLAADVLYAFVNPKVRAGIVDQQA